MLIYRKIEYFITFITYMLFSPNTSSINFFLKLKIFIKKNVSKTPTLKRAKFMIFECQKVRSNVLIVAVPIIAY